MKTYKASEFKAMDLLDRAKAYISASSMEVQVEFMDEKMLSDIGTEGLVFDGYVVYLAKGEYEFSSILGKRLLPGYHVWKEIGIPATRWSPPDADVVELLTTQSESEAIAKCLEVVLNSRLEDFCGMLGDSEAAEAMEEYERIADGLADYL